MNQSTLTFVPSASSYLSPQIFSTTMSLDDVVELIKRGNSYLSITVSANRSAQNATDSSSSSSSDDEKQKKKISNSRVAHFNETIRNIFDDEEPPKTIKDKKIVGSVIADVLEELRKEKISYKWAPHFVKKNIKWVKNEKRCEEMKQALSDDFKKLLEYCDNKKAKLPSVNYFMHHRATAHKFDEILPLLKCMKTQGSIAKYDEHYNACFA